MEFGLIASHKNGRSNKTPDKQAKLAPSIIIQSPQDL